MRPHIVAYMLSSFDGRIDSKSWSGQSGISADALGAAYEDVHRALKSDAWIVGRTTMAEFADGEITIAASMT